MNKKKVVVLTGAGISAESGISTFRDAGGLWEGHAILDVASPQGWDRNKNLVLDFYNKRRKQLLEVKPNAAHLALVTLESNFDVTIITQNVDDLHERAGSSNIIHLHGELRKVRSTGDPSCIYLWDGPLVAGDCCEKGFQLRPHIVWFGEDVPAMPYAIKAVQQADTLLIIGTSLQVYPAASLIHFTTGDAEIYYIDPKPDNELERHFPKLQINADTACRGVPELVEVLLKRTGGISVD
ncbi:MAG: NAD-dependent deacylase [Saprospiraceae bacterium]|jgi:NAD-dependent deacetylase|nr:NAD-dependent deacylase [Saprospiraceae bacterium]